MAESPTPLPQGAVIGILGGGQLGRMLSVAASRLGYRCHIYEPAPGAPAGHVAERLFTAAWDDAAMLAEFAAGVDVVTYEFENVPTATLDMLEGLRPVRPGRRALAISQDRVLEKGFLNDLGLSTTRWAAVSTEADLPAAVATTGLPAILKTARFGYDGKGQARVTDADRLAGALAGLDGAPAILESLVAFEREISVIAARGLDGTVAAYDPGENLHQGGILRKTTVPAAITRAQRADAVLLAGRILNALDYVGVMGIELFVTRAGLLVNEIAPRVHNSGHWTQQGCAVDQFEQHIRAVAGLPLGDGHRHCRVTMENLIGDDMARLPAILREKDAAVHFYGKAEVRAGRKMGHVNRITPG